MGSGEPSKHRSGTPRRHHQNPDIRSGIQIDQMFKQMDGFRKGSGEPSKHRLPPLPAGTTKIQISAPAIKSMSF